MAIEVAYMVAAAHAAVKAQVAKINDLNVYPVPDGDTGTNMLLTLGSTLNETSGKSYGSPEEASRACARAALMGARGNSGVILSQMIRGACEVLADRRSLDAEAFAAGLEGARERAYASVREPVEGTLTCLPWSGWRGRRPTIRCAAPRSCSMCCGRPASSMQGGWVLPWFSTESTPALAGRRSRSLKAATMTRQTWRRSTRRKRPGDTARSSSSRASVATWKRSRSASTLRAGVSSWSPKTM